MITKELKLLIQSAITQEIIEQCEKCLRQNADYCSIAEVIKRYDENFECVILKTSKKGKGRAVKVCKYNLEKVINGIMEELAKC